MSVTVRMIKTGHADIAVAGTSGRELPLLLIHGNSSCKEVFRSQLDSELAARYRMIAIDLPGHGASSDAFSPERTYSMPGYAETAMEVLAELGIDRVAVLGWSLGGHVAMELMPRLPGLVGIMIAGAPPVRRDIEAIQQGFQPNPAVFLAGKNAFTAEDYEAFGALTLGRFAADAELRKALHRAHGAARQMMFESLMAGRASDQRELVERASLPVAVVNGERDPVVNVDYIGGLSYGTLWDEHCYILRGLAHVPFLESPTVFNPLLGRFMSDMARQAAQPFKVGKRSGTAAA